MVFWRKGYDGATQEEMLAATGLSSSTLYRSFGNKADIFESALQRYTATASAVFAPLEHGVSGAGDLYKFFDNVEAWLTGPMGSSGCLVVETMQDPINRDPRISSVTSSHLDRMGEGLRAAVRRGIDADELRPSHAARFADALQAGVLGVLARARGGDVSDAVRLLDGVRALLPERSAH